MPVSTFVRLAVRPSSTKTKRSSPSPITASSGTPSDWRSREKTLTVSSMPGFSALSGLGMIARTRTARVAGSITGSIVAIVPLNGRSGQAADSALIGMPSRIIDRRVSGTVKSSLIREMSLTVAIAVPAVMTAPGETVRRETQPLNGARMVRSPMPARARSALARALLASAICCSTVAPVAKPRDLSAWMRFNCWSACSAVASAAASSAFSWPTAMRAITCPLDTKPPSVKFSTSIRSVTGADNITCSLASAVPTASTLSVKRVGAIATASTRAGGRAFFSFSPPQPARQRATRMTGRVERMTRG